MVDKTVVVVKSSRRAKHNADGSTTIEQPSPPKARTDPKPRGRRRG